MFKIEDTKFPFIAFLLMFFLGLCGLIYLTTWMHLLRLVMEYPVYAEVTVLIIFAGGIALGGLLAGRFSDLVFVPLRVFALLSFIASFLVILSPLFIELELELFKVLYAEFFDSVFMLNLFRVGLLSLPLLFPAALIGSAMTLLSANAVRFGSGVGSSVGLIYGAGGFGAATGLLLSGFFLHPYFGYEATLNLAADLNMVVALGALFLSFKFESSGELFPVEVKKKYVSSSDEKFTVFMVLFFAFIAMSYHVIFFRIITLLTGYHLHTFIYITGLFAISLSLGCVVSSRFSDKIQDVNFMLGLIVISFTLSALIVSSAVQVSSSFLSIFINGSESMLSIGGLRFFVLLLCSALPGFVLGFAFPLAVRLQVLDDKNVGFSMGHFDFYSVVGASLGIMLSLWIFIPTFGIRGAFLFVVFISGLFSLVLIYLSKLNEFKKKVAAAMMIVLLPQLFVLTPRWDNLSIVETNAHVQMYIENPDDLDFEGTENGLIFHDEGVFSTTSILKNDRGVMELIVDGAIEATTEKKDLIVKDLLVHVAFLMRQSADNVLMIGMGSGAPLEAVVSHPDIKNIDIVEISENVIESSKFFRSVNKESMLDWRVKVNNIDARFYVEHTDMKYDKVISVLSKPALYSGVGYFTEEYFTNVANVLSDGGLMIQLVDGKDMTEDGFKSLLATFLEAFTFAHLWEVNRDDKQYILVGSLDRLSIDYNTLKERLDVEIALHSLGDIGVTDFTTLMNFFIMDSGSMRKYSRSSIINTYDNNYLAFHAGTSFDLFAEVEEFRVPPFLLLDNLPPDAYDDMVDSYLSVLLIRDLYGLLEDGDIKTAEVNADRLIDTFGHNSDVLYKLSEIYLTMGRVVSKNNMAGAIGFYNKSLSLNNKNPDAFYYQSLAQLKLGNLEEAYKSIGRAGELSGASPRVHRLLAEIYEKKGDAFSAKKEYDLAKKLLTVIDETL